jgi:hypothetical protein
MGLLSIIMIKPIYGENLRILEVGSKADVQEKKVDCLPQKVEVPLLYALKSRAVLTLSRLRRRVVDSESESEEQAS